MAMYEKNLKEDLRLRLSTRDMDFLRLLSEQRGCSVSECIRGILAEYRRSQELVSALNNLVNLSQKECEKMEGAELSRGDTNTHFDDKL